MSSGDIFRLQSKNGFALTQTQKTQSVAKIWAWFFRRWSSHKSLRVLHRALVGPCEEFLVAADKTATNSPRHCVRPMPSLFLGVGIRQVTLFHVPHPPTHLTDMSTPFPCFFFWDFALRSTFSFFACLCLDLHLITLLSRKWWQGHDTGCERSGVQHYSVYNRCPVFTALVSS